VWKVHAEVAGCFEPGQALLVLEAMKMEVALEPDAAVMVVQVLVAEGASVRAGQPLVIVKTN
jgi:urea carboxylase